MAKKQTIPQEQCIFDADEMGGITKGDLWEKEDEPVVCLGMTFDSEEARREYFRNELRKKLPELRNIEGFPIGTDDDIINLSDPPYYTACPNPWLNDFIAQWEEEKKQLVAEGKRDEDKVVTEPYASDVSEGKNNPIYMAHAYHTKVPHPAIMRYILHYTEPGDIVFDGFCGTGMTGVAAQLCGSVSEVSKLNEKDCKIGIRHSVCSDLSPIATLIAATYNNPFDKLTFKRKATSILQQVEKELGWMYETTIDGKKAKVNYTIWSDVFVCPSCGEELILWNETVDLNNNLIKNEFPCPHCGHICTKNNMEKCWETQYDSILKKTIRVNKKVPVRTNYTSIKRGEINCSSLDISLINSIDYNYIDYKPKELLVGFNTSQPIKSNGITHIHQFYTKRNFIYLSRVLELIKKEGLPMTWFTSVLQNASSMYKFRTDRKGGILNGTLFVPSLNIEQSPYSLLNRKISDFINASYKERGNSCISILSSTSLDLIKNDSIDYIFTDPPFGSNIMYSELSSIWEGWLGVVTNNNTEAIINEFQQKNIYEYQQLMIESLKEFYYILKPGKWLTMEFSNTSASVWNSIQNALQSVGFIVANVSALDKQQGSFKAVTSTTAVKQDLVITCFKPSEKLISTFNNFSKTIENVWNFIDEYLNHLPIHLVKGNATTTIVERNPKILYDRLIAFYVQKGYPVPIDAKDFQKGLRERYIEKDGMFFTALQAAEYEEKKKAAPEFVPMGIIVSDEANGIEWLKNQLRDAPKTYQEIQPEWMQAINGVRKGDILPELKTILEENFIEMDDGKWRLPNIQDDVDKTLMRTKALLKEFNIYKEQANKAKGKIKEARVEALRAGFKQCYIDKDFQTIVTVGDKIPQNLRDEDEVLLQFYDIALNKI